MLYIGTTKAEKNALRVAAHRGKLNRIARGIYSDDITAAPEELVKSNFLAIVGKLLPDWHLSHSTAATLKPIDGIAFLSARSTTHKPYQLPGLKLIREKAINYPEVDWIEAPTKIASSLQSEPEIVKVQVSGRLQTIFECLSSVKTYPEKNLPESQLLKLVANLGPTDRERTEAFSFRNEMRIEYFQLKELMEKQSFSGKVNIANRQEFSLFFYGWEIGKLTGLSSEYRFEYDPAWEVSLSPQLPVGKSPAYEGVRMPSFFENLLPEGWMENQLQSTFKIAKEDELGLLATTEKYLSNLTLQTSDLDTSKTTFDTLEYSLKDLVTSPEAVLEVEDLIIQDKDLQTVLRTFGSKGPVRVSGVQAKLPVSIELNDSKCILKLGVLNNSCSHIIKYQSPSFPNMVENEWATMELASRVGLPVATVRMVKATKKTELFPGRALLIERYDIPTKNDLETKANIELALQQDVASLLSLSRIQKYDTSAEKVAKALTDCPIEISDMNTYLAHLIFCWFVGNGDLHAKNVSVIKWLNSGKLGSYPSLKRISYSPLYDLVNTKICLPGDKFAISVNGHNDNLKKKDFAAIGERWDLNKKAVTSLLTDIAEKIQQNVAEVLEHSLIPEDLSEKYRAVVERNIDEVLG